MLLVVSFVHHTEEIIIAGFIRGCVPQTSLVHPQLELNPQHFAAPPQENVLLMKMYFLVVNFVNHTEDMI